MYPARRIERKFNISGLCSSFAYTFFLWLHTLGKLPHTRFSNSVIEIPISRFRTCIWPLATVATAVASHHPAKLSMALMLPYAYAELAGSTLFLNEQKSLSRFDSHRGPGLYVMQL